MVECLLFDESSVLSSTECSTQCFVDFAAFVDFFFDVIEVSLEFFRSHVDRFFVDILGLFECVMIGFEILDDSRCSDGAS